MLICVILYIILINTGVVSSNSSAVLLAIVVLTNTFNLIILMFILGYGLIAFPQILWYSGDLDYYLLQLQYKAAHAFRELNDITINLRQIVADAKKTNEKVIQFNNYSI